jgi:hypothetical protein
VNEHIHAALQFFDGFGGGDGLAYAIVHEGDSNVNGGRIAQIHADRSPAARHNIWDFCARVLATQSKKGGLAGNTT